jgi:hypothetical protein
VADLYTLDVPPDRLIMSLVVVTPTGEHCAVSTRPDATYVYRTDGMDAYREAPRVFAGPS